MLPHSIAPIRLNDLRDPKDLVAGPDNRAGGHLLDEPRRASATSRTTLGVEPDAAGEHLNEIVAASL
jgi:hypothetical protein